jgi:hypothetical protein
MASEEPKTETAPAPAAEAPAAETSTSEKKSNGKKGNRDERPIEELYDLSKPIPRVSPCGRSQMTVTISVEFYGNCVPGPILIVHFGSSSHTHVLVGWFPTTVYNGISPFLTSFFLSFFLP